MKRKIIDRSDNRYVTMHRQTAKRPAIKRAIHKLSREWNDLDPVQRGEALCRLTAAGCSQRGLPEELGQSATSIRRHIAIAKLPEADREAVLAGKSVKTTLAQKAQDARRLRSQQRIAEDMQTGAISDQLADEILEFCKANPGVRGSDIESIITFFNEVRNSLTRFEWQRERPKKMRRSLPLEQRFKLTRPHRDKEEAEIIHLAHWLAIFLKSGASERPILSGALDKAEARRKELQVAETKTPRQTVADAALKYAYLSASPPPRKYSAKGARALRGSY